MELQTLLDKYKEMCIKKDEIERKVQELYKEYEQLEQDIEMIQTMIMYLDNKNDKSNIFK